MFKKISDSNQVPQKAEQLVKENVRFSMTNFNCILNDVSVSNDRPKLRHNDIPLIFHDNMQSTEPIILSPGSITRAGLSRIVNWY